MQDEKIIRGSTRRQFIGNTLATGAAFALPAFIPAPALGRGVVTDQAFRTSLPGVYAAGDCAEVAGRIEPLWYAAKRQGEAAARAMLGETVEYTPPTYYNSAKFFHLEWTGVGETAAGPGRFRKLPGREASVRVIEREGVVVSFSMLGSRWNHRVLARWVEER
ncbi:MAG: hypothetical protein NT029_11660, partial [Armatimonadetes bacterium]|nr:hypothetical protein [Armatimonadota bacterium]